MMQRSECDIGQDYLSYIGLLKDDEDYYFPKFFQREMQEFHELIY